eukprot:gb/GEZN01002221.1/.p1 GENE.gb/GEZN01002221.1/~~gb/GEZN01002221.1/.p1  ORF type:complete len:796 (-),score=91.14 gb/GEZN01002221.1/:158-2545(-)
MTMRIVSRVIKSRSSHAVCIGLGHEGRTGFRSFHRNSTSRGENSTWFYLLGENSTRPGWEHLSEQEDARQELQEDEVRKHLMACWAVKDDPRSVSEAERLFQSIPTESRNTELYNIMIAGYGSRGKVSPMLVQYEQLCSAHTPTAHTFSSLLSALAEAREYSLFERYLHEMDRHGVPRSIYVWCVMLRCYLQAGDKARVDALLRAHTNLLQESVTYHTLMAHARDMNDLGELKRYYQLMLRLGLQPNVVTYGILIDGYSRSGDLPRVMELFREMQKAEIQPSIQIFHQLIQAHGRQKDLAGVLAHFGKLRCSLQPEALSYQLLFHELVALGQAELLEQYFDQMLADRNVIPRSRMYDSLLRVLASCNYGTAASRSSKKQSPRVKRQDSTVAKQRPDFEKMLFRFRQMQEKGVSPSHLTLHVLIQAFGEHGDTERMLRYLDEMAAGGFAPRTDTYNISLGVMASHADMSGLELVLEHMERSQTRANARTYHALMRAYVRAKYFGLAEQCFLYMQRQGLVPGTMAFNTLMHAFTERESVGYVSHCFLRCEAHEAVNFSVLRTHAEAQQKQLLSELGPGAERGEWSWLRVWRALGGRDMRNGRVVRSYRLGQHIKPTDSPQCPDISTVRQLLHWMLETDANPDQGTRRVLDRAIWEGSVPQACALVRSIHGAGRSLQGLNPSRKVLINLLQRIRQQYVRENDTSAALLARKMADRLQFTKVSRVISTSGMEEVQTHESSWPLPAGLLEELMQSVLLPKLAHSALAQTSDEPSTFREAVKLARNQQLLPSKRAAKDDSV